MTPTPPVDRLLSAQAAYLEYVASLPKRRLRSIDAEYRGKRYRIEESAREQGASVWASGDHVACSGCLRQLGPTTKRLVVRPALRAHCLGCAIGAGLLLRLPGDLVADAVDAAREAGIAW